MTNDEPWAFDGPPSEPSAYELSHVSRHKPTQNAVILALDCSSTMIGWVVYDDAARDHGEIKLPGSDLALRCKRAFASVGLIIETHPDIDCVAIESLVARFAKAVIPQACVHGAVLTRIALFGLHAIEVTPGQAKRQLTSMGDAYKGEMRAAALVYGVEGEHASDALGIALFAASRVKVVA